MLSSVRALARPLTAAILVPALLLGAAGCGGGDKDDPLLAVVGDKEIHVSDYEGRLKLLEQDELPRDDEGRTHDMATREGKEAFLKTLVNKELMVLKATQLGYADDPRIAGARESMTAYEASLAMGQDVINDPAGEVTFEEFDRFYERMGELRRCKYIVTNFEAEARAAREMALDGADWDDVADRYHAGDIPPTGVLEVTVPWGRFDIEFEDKVFATELGGVSEPIHTDYGWWLVRVEEIVQGEKPDAEAARADILDVIHRRKMGRLQKDFRHQVYEKYDLRVDDDALYIVWQALPENELMIDPATNKPVPQDQLLPLEIPASELDQPFYSYTLDGERRAYTVGDYKNRYDRMNTFQRPKREQMVGGLKAHILQELERALMSAEARERGYFEDPEVTAKVAKKMEELMVTSLYGEVVTIDEKITGDEFDAYWQENRQRFAKPERRSGRLVIAQDEAGARTARQRLADGERWRDVVMELGTDPANKSRSGKLDDVSERATGPVPEVLFALGQDELSEPFPVGDGRWAVLRCERIIPGQPADRVADREAVYAAMRAERKEDLFQSLLAQWEEEFGVTRHPENLAHVQSWQELTYVPPAENPVPRSGDEG